jgi:hypothetical protein
MTSLVLAITSLVLLLICMVMPSWSMAVNVEGSAVFHPLVPDVVVDVAALEVEDVDMEVVAVPMQSSMALM